MGRRRRKGRKRDDYASRHHLVRLEVCGNEWEPNMHYGRKRWPTVIGSLRRLWRGEEVGVDPHERSTSFLLTFVL